MKLKPIIEGRHYDKTKDMANMELSRYIDKNLKVGDIVGVGQGRKAKVVAGPQIGGKVTYFWIQIGSEPPQTASSNDMDILKGM